LRLYQRDGARPVVGVGRIGELQPGADHDLADEPPSIWTVIDEDDPKAGAIMFVRHRYLEFSEA
jgi:hypothetical protein